LALAEALLDASGPRSDLLQFIRKLGIEDRLFNSAPLVGGWVELGADASIKIRAASEPDEYQAKHALELHPDMAAAAAELVVHSVGRRSKRR
jgi:hypothetical protein